MTITTANKRGMSTETLEKGLECCKWTARDSALEVALNLKHLQAVIAPLKKVVRIGLGGPLEPVHLGDEGYGAAIMPVALSQASAGVPQRPRSTPRRGFRGACAACATPPRGCAARWRC